MDLVYFVGVLILIGIIGYISDLVIKDVNRRNSEKYREQNEDIYRHIRECSEEDSQDPPEEQADVHQPDISGSGKERQPQTLEQPNKMSPEQRQQLVENGMLQMVKLAAKALQQKQGFDPSTFEETETTFPIECKHNYFSADDINAFGSDLTDLCSRVIHDVCTTYITRETHISSITESDIEGFGSDLVAFTHTIALASVMDESIVKNNSFDLFLETKKTLENKWDGDLIDLIHEGTLCALKDWPQDSVSTTYTHT